MASSIPTAPAPIGAEQLDFIGDVHGCGELLQRLLSRLGYAPDPHGVYRHPERRAVFVGDLVDRGPQVRWVLDTVRAMVEAGSAILLLGNHELNLIGHFEPAARESGQTWLRPRTERSLRGLRATLAAFEGAESALRDHVAWLKRQPLCLETDRVRGVHACWDEAWCGWLREHRPGFVLRQGDWLDCSRRGHAMRRCVDRLLNGTVHPLPEGLAYRDTHGILRRQIRTNFWSGDARRLHELVFAHDQVNETILQARVDAPARRKLVNYPREERPVIFGHYWFRGLPGPIRANLACVDYSAVLGGPLVAYRFDGEQALQASKFVAVHPQAPPPEGD